MKILYLAKYDPLYRQGNYIEDWIATFKNKFPDIMFYGPGFETKLEELPYNIDLVVYGHTFFDIYNLEKSSFIKKKLFYGLDITKFKKIKSVYFSKNEYKNMADKLEFIKKLKDCLLVVYSKITLEKYKSIYNNIICIPFGINSQRFINYNQPRNIDIGMRGNKHDKYISDLRLKVADKVLTNLIYLNLDIILSVNGEDFMPSDLYIKWLNNSKFTINTISAFPMNPKFSEIIACGSIPICPCDYYEDVILKDKHYIDIEEVMKIKSVDEFKDFYFYKYNSMKPFLDKYIDYYNYNNLIDILFSKLDN